MNPLDPVNFLSFWITTVLAGLALAMPVVKWLCRRWLNRIEVIVDDSLGEVNFGPIGPTVALMVTVHGWPLDQFVRTMNVTVKRERDGALTNLTWIALRPLTLAEQVDLNLVKIATGFKLAAGDAVPASVVFIDHDTRQRVQEHLRALNGKWVEYLKKRGVPLADMDADDLQQAYEYFASGQVGPHIANAKDEIDRLFYWQEDSYELRLTVETFNPTIRKSVERRFKLTREQVQQLRLGIMTAILQFCNNPQHGVVTAAFPKLEEVAKKVPSISK